MCGCLSHGPHWGPGPQPRHLPWLGIKPETLWFTARTQSTELCQPGSEQFLNSSVLMAFNISVVFCSTHSTLAKCFPLRTVLILRNEQKKCIFHPRLVWLSRLSASPWTKGPLVQFPVRAHAWVVGQVPSRGPLREATTHWCFSPSLSPSLPLCLEINK